MALESALGMLGFGNMGQAIARGLVATRTMAAAKIAVFDVDEPKRALARALGAVAAASPEDLARQSEVFLIAVKPQSFDAAIEPIIDTLPQEALVVSIMAGVSIASIQKRLGADRRVVRVMPNLPALVGAGAAGIALSSTCAPADKETARAVFESVGTVEFVPEDAMDVITALSGSGPAYFFYVVECLTHAATRHGLPEDQAARLAAQTVLGAALLLRDSGEPAAVLRQRVTSKGGTTEAALNAFREKGLDEVIAAGVAAAAARSRELGK